MSRSPHSKKYTLLIAILGFVFSASPVFAATLFGNTPPYITYSNEHGYQTVLGDDTEVWIEYNATTTSILLNTVKVWMCGTHIGGTQTGGSLKLELVINGTSTGTIIASSTIAVTPDNIYIGTTVGTRCDSGTGYVNGTSTTWRLTVSDDYPTGIVISSGATLWFRLTSYGNTGKAFYLNNTNTSDYGSANFTPYTVNEDYTGWDENDYSGWHYVAGIQGLAGGFSIETTPEELAEITWSCPLPLTGGDPCGSFSNFANATIESVGGMVSTFNLASTTPFSYFYDIRTLMEEMDATGTTSIRFAIPIMGQTVVFFDTASTTYHFGMGSTTVGTPIKATIDALYVTVLALTVISYAWVRLRSVV